MKNKSMMNGILNNPKAFLFISILLAFVADLMSTVMIFKAGYELQYLLFPLIILIMDIIFFVLSIFSNYRFRYSILQMIAYLIVILSGVGAVTILFATSANEIIMTIVSCLLWASVHILGLVAVLLNSLHASKISKKQKKFVPITSITLLSALVVIFTASICHNGFFGQGYIEEARTLSYVYSEEDQGYIVQSTLKGRGNTAIIPTEFNGEPVVAIDCEMLKEEDLRAVRFEKGHSNIKFKNTDNLKDYELNQDMTFYAEKEDIDNIKTTLFSYWSNDSKTGILKLTNTFYPVNLDDDEVYITFSYTNEAYDNANGVVFKTWFGHKGDKFDIEFDDQVPYALHSDLEDNNDLHWNYTNNNKLILKSLLDDKGNLINGSEINDSIKNVQVDFEKIYAVRILEDNDTKYETEDSYRYTYLDNSTLEYKYVLKDTANNLIDSIPLRDGFNLSFKHNNNSISFLKEIILEEGNNDIIEISPFWELKAPENLEVYTNNHNNTFTYGDNIVLSGDFNEVTDGILYTYNWSFGSNNYSGDDYQLNNVVPSQSGKYVLTVTAYSDTITSLTSTTSKEVNITIDKKILNFNWVLPMNLIYSGENKTISCNYNDSQVINNDSITFSIDGDQIYNAGRYNFNVTLTGSCNDLYKIPASDSSISFEIEKKEVGLTWEETNYIYNGTKQVPNVNITGLIGIDSCDVNVSVNGGVNAGTYTARATSLTNNNYKLPTFNTHTYSIDKKTIQANVVNGSGVYNDYYNAATATLIGVEDSDIVNVIITYVGRANDGTNYNSTVVPQKAGTYDVVVTINNSNYNLEETKGLFIMDKASLEIPTITSKTYTGNKLSANTLNSSLYEITRNVEEINVGSYVIEVSLLDFNNYKWANSSNISIETNFVITKADNSWTTNPSITGWIYGKNANNPVYRSKFGTVKVEYSSNNGSTWSQTIPEEAGTYKVRFTVEDTNNYSGLVKEIDFVIEKATVNVPTISAKTYTGNNLIADVPTSNLYTVTLNEGGINVGNNYEVHLTLNDSKNYKWSNSSESTITIYFTIKQASNSWTTTPSIEGWTYGDLANDPQYGAKFGTVKVEYSSNGNVWTEEVPVNKGSYLVRFTVAGTSNYTGLTATKSIEISAKEITADVDYGGGIYDSIIDPVTVTFSGVLYGDDVGVVITYSGTSNSGVSYNGTMVPEEAGTYTVTIKITNDNYSFNKVTGSFVIEKASNSWETTPSITNWTYGDTPNNPEYAAKYGTVKVEYSSDNGITWSTKVPTKAGTYKVRFIVSEAANYTGLSYETNLVIEQKEITASVTNGGGTYGSVTPVTVTLNGIVDGDNVAVTITYTGNGYNSTIVPTKAGTYTVTITINDSNYNLIVVPVTFVISQAENAWEAEPVIEGWVEGETPNAPSYDSRFGTVKVEYSSDNGSTWSQNVPEEAGTYKVRFTVEETNDYTGLTKEINFQIEEVNDLENN